MATEYVLAVPAKGDDGAPLCVRIPGYPGERLPEEGARVPRTAFWERRARHGEVELKPLPAKSSRADREPTKKIRRRKPAATTEPERDASESQE